MGGYGRFHVWGALLQLSTRITWTSWLRAQVEALLDKIGQQPPVMDYVAWQLERLGYAWSYRVVETTGASTGFRL